MTHSGTSCCTSGAGDLHCCDPVRFDFGPAGPALASSSGEHCFSGVPGWAGESTTSGEPGFPWEPGSWLGGPSPFPGDGLLRGLWSLPLPRDIRLRRPTESSSLAASFFASGLGGAGGGGGGGGGGLGPGVAFSPLLPRAGCSGDLTPLLGGSLAVPGSSPGSTLLTTFLTAFATFFRDRPGASSPGPSAEGAPRPFMAGVGTGLLVLWEVSAGAGLAGGCGLLDGPLPSFELPSSYSHTDTGRRYPQPVSLPTPCRGSKRCGLTPSPETDLPFMQQTRHSSKRLSSQHLRVWCLSPTKTGRYCCHLPGLARSCEMPTQNTWRPMRCPRVAAIRQGQRPSPNPDEPGPSQPTHSRDGAQRGQATHSRPHAGASCLCGPSVTWFSGQPDPGPAHPDENNSQGAIPGPKIGQASSLPAPLVCSHCLFRTHILKAAEPQCWPRKLPAQPALCPSLLVSSCKPLKGWKPPGSESGRVE